MNDLTKIDVLDATQKVGDQFLSAVKQSQGLVLDAAKTVADALPAVPSGVSEAPVLSTLPDFPAFVAYGFDLAAELLAVQKEFVVTLASTFVPAKSA